MDFVISLLDKFAAVFRTGPGRDVAIVTLAVLIMIGLIFCAWTFLRLKMMVEGVAMRVTRLEKRFRRARKVAAQNHETQRRLLGRIIKAMGLPTEVT